MCRGRQKTVAKMLTDLFIYFIAEVECRDPMSPKNGYIEVSNFKGKISRGILTVLFLPPLPQVPAAKAGRNKLIICTVRHPPPHCDRRAL
jgi:hypothetical protein